MKLLLTIVLLSLLPGFVAGQACSAKIDSLTRSYIDKLPAKEKEKFGQLLNQRDAAGTFKRIDTTAFDFLFLEESYCYHDTSGRVTERYFTGKDSALAHFYINGNLIDSHKVYEGFMQWHSGDVIYYTDYPLHFLVNKYSKLKPTQSLSYDKKQVWSHGCVVSPNGRKFFEQKRIGQLKTTYQVLTMVDRKKNKIIVSVQYAPAKPKITIYDYNAVWDF
jgi:hypothetical protein